MAAPDLQSRYSNVIKAIKTAYETTPVGSAQRQGLSTQAQAIRNAMKAQGLDTTGLDADTPLNNTPGGPSVDWNQLAQTANDWGGTTRSGSVNTFQNTLGNWLKGQITGWKSSLAPATDASAQASYLQSNQGVGNVVNAGNIRTGITMPTFTAQPVNNTTQPVNPPLVAQSVPAAPAADTGTAPTPTVGQLADTVQAGTTRYGTPATTASPTPVVPASVPAAVPTTPVPAATASPTPMNTAPVVDVGTNGQAPKGLSVGTTVRTAGGNYQITAVNPDGTYQSTKVGASGIPPATSAPPSAGDTAAMTAYMKNQNPQAYFQSVHPDWPTTMSTNGQKVIDVTKMSNAQLLQYQSDDSTLTKINTLLAQEGNMTTANIANDPMFKAMNDMYQVQLDQSLASMNTALQLKLNALNAQKATVNANYQSAMSDIDNAVSQANWRSRQSLAASGMAFGGVLALAYGRNEASYASTRNATIQNKLTDLNKIASDIATVTSDTATSTDLATRAEQAQVGVERLKLLGYDPATLNDIKTQLSGLQAQLSSGSSAITAEQTTRAKNAAATTAKNEQALKIANLYGQYGITVKQDKNGNIVSMSKEPTADQKLKIAAQAFDQWYKTKSLNIDFAKLSDARQQQQFDQWAKTQGLKLTAAQLAETIRNHKATETEKSSSYKPTEDLALVNSGRFMDSGQGSAPYLRLAANSGTATSNDAAFNQFLNGTPGTEVRHFLAKSTIDPKTVVPGALSLPETDFNTVLSLIKDPVRAGEAWILYAVKNGEYSSTADALKAAAETNKWTASQVTQAAKYLKTAGGK